jgi:nucleotide-binding universal stress UspA family protein
MYQRILVATDGSKLSKKATRSAVKLAFLTGADLVALTVVARYPVSYFDSDITISREDVSRIESQWVASGQAVVDSVRSEAESAGVNAKAVVVRSSLVAESIVSAAKKHKCDLVVMASHGRKGLNRLLLGSETQNVLASSSIPVLVLR